MRGRRIVRERWLPWLFRDLVDGDRAPSPDRRGVEELHHSPTTPASAGSDGLRYIASSIRVPAATSALRVLEGCCAPRASMSLGHASPASAPCRLNRERPTLHAIQRPAPCVEAFLMDVK